MKEDIRREIELKQGVTAKAEGSLLFIKGPRGEVQRNCHHPKLGVSVEPGKIILLVHAGTKREKTIIGAYEAHVRNLVRGVQEVHTYKLKVCSGHFPISVTVSGNQFLVKNFLGETVPRKFTLPPHVEVKVNGSDITVSSPDLELAGMVAARMEQLCRITNRDMRVFQDGIYITQKAE